MTVFELPDATRLGVLVHEVRSPVAALAAVSEAFVRGGLEPGERVVLAGLAVDACRSIERLVTDHAVASVRLEDVDPGQLVRSAVAAASVGGANVRANVASGLPTVRADPLRVRQAIDNLVENALVHGARGGEVVVHAALEGSELVVAVEDAGPGIADSDRARIFEPGVSLACAPRSGLGLAVARAIATAHGGSLGVQSEPGEGTIFTLRFPVAQP